MYNYLFNNDKTKSVKSDLFITLGVLLVFLLLLWYRETYNADVNWNTLFESFLSQLIGAFCLFILTSVIYYVYVLITKKKFNLTLPTKIFNLYIILGVIKVVAELSALSLNSENRAWGESYEKNVRKGMLGKVGTMYNPKDAPRMVDCIIQKLKIQYPNGTDKVSMSELVEFQKKTSIECMEELNITEVLWNPAIEKELVIYLETKILTDIQEKETREKIAICLLNKLKSKYPTKMPESGFSESDSELLLECLREYTLID